MIRSLCCLMVMTSLFQTQTSHPSPKDSRFLSALRAVESGGNDDAVGDGGKAIGPYQIWKIYWKDALEFDPTIGGKYEDCFDRQYSERVVVAYLNRYATEKRLGRMPRYEDMARIHNGGPNGHKKSATNKYWNKVNRELDKNV